MYRKINVRFPAPPGVSYPVEISSSYRVAAAAVAGKGDHDGIYLVSDATVMRLYGRDFAAILTRKGLKVRTFSLAPGEASKTRAVKSRLEDLLLRAGATRSSLLVAMGGGVIGDLAGFTASTLLRGIGYIHLPTTLLSQVDSSVGGKVAVNHPLGKNLIGAFYHPVAVHINTSVLASLPEREFRSGMAEVIKYSVILDRDLFDLLRRRHRAVTRRDTSLLGDIIERCCRLKASVVRKDERDSGYRRILNFGHTVGHAVERSSRFTIPHGFAVASGMAAEAGLSREIGLCPDATLSSLLELLRLYKLPVVIPRTLRGSRILAALEHDKKKSHGQVGYTLLRGIGKAVTGVRIPAGTVGSFIRP